MEVLNKDKPTPETYKLLGTWYARLINTPKALENETLKASYLVKAIENFKASYALKKNAQVAYNLGILLNQNQELDSALEYLAESHLLNDEKFSPEAQKLLQHLVYFEKTKGQPQPEQDKVYNEIIAAAKVRLGITLP
jgi:tetratricopeptide (TPR) repeat protein